MIKRESEEALRPREKDVLIALPPFVTGRHDCSHVKMVEEE